MGYFWVTAFLVSAEIFTVFVHYDRGSDMFKSAFLTRKIYNRYKA